MPIRFRCAYCNQLMGISRKKAGTVVRCPKCAGEIIVPAPDGGADADEPADQPAGPGALEDMKFEQILNQPDNGAAAPAALPPREEMAPAPPPIAAMRPEVAPPPPAPAEPPRRRGLFLSMSMLLVSVGVVILLLILMFVFGLIIGRATMIPPKTAALHPAALTRHASETVAWRFRERFPRETAKRASTTLA